VRRPLGNPYLAFRTAMPLADVADLAAPLPYTDRRDPVRPLFL